MVDDYGGAVWVPCGNRRQTVCPTCSDRYAVDAFHLIRASSPNGPGTSATTPRCATGCLGCLATAMAKRSLAGSDQRKSDRARTSTPRVATCASSTACRPAAVAHTRAVCPIVGGRLACNGIWGTGMLLRWANVTRCCLCLRGTRRG